MFTGIIESLGVVKEIVKQESNLKIWFSCSFFSEINIDQSIAHNGVCLTVTELDTEKKWYCAVAVAETLAKTNISLLKEGDIVNLERCVEVGSRFDGHIVQGHVDTTAVCTTVENMNGSWRFIFENDGSCKNLVVTKGSVTVNGVSLTVVDAAPHSFSVAIIPYTFDHTTFKEIKPGSKVNVEFDILGKYAVAYMSGAYN